MWRVQSVGEFDTPREDYALFGMVSRGDGFLDSPDAEVISGGVNTKRRNAVAIGRHGNFFHWGFAASPTHLTDDAKLVLVNAIHYIAQFEGQRVLARNRPGTVLRTHLSREIAALESGRFGDDVSQLRRYFSDESWARIDKSPQSLARLLRSVGPYFFPADSWYSLAIDADLKELRLPNNAPDFLERVGKLLDDAAQAELACRVLSRYTAVRLEGPGAWKAWLEENSGRFFFSERAGYKWIVEPRQD
ncbi:MAG: hypothetical protein AAF488_10505 [Planctomycetota bacterium]